MNILTETLVYVVRVFSVAVGGRGYFVKSSSDGRLKKNRSAMRTCLAYESISISNIYRECSN